MMLSRYFLLIYLNLFICQVSFGQAADVLRLIPVRTNSPITIDGILTETDWKNVAGSSAFMQAQPVPGSAASMSTRIQLLYDNDYLYIAVTAFDSAGNYIVSGFQRDKYFRNDDGISIMIDTYNDKSHALLFFANVAGARFDEEISDNGSTFNSAYNTFWSVMVAKSQTGYVAEFRIPFSSLRFQSKDEVVMGLKVIRQTGRKNEFDIFPPCEPNTGNMVWRINTEAEIVFEKLEPVKPLYLTPYVKANYATTNSLNANTNAYEKSSDCMFRNYFIGDHTADRVISNIGADAKIGVSKNFTLDATLNTDFAQVEADNRVFNFTRFNINLPEKRQFFLEANDYLNFSVAGDCDLFTSRNIGIENGHLIPIIGGIRLTGKSKGWQLGTLSMQTQGLKSAGVNPENFAVTHLHRDLFGNGSYASAFFANRVTTNHDSISNQTAGFDFLHRLNNTWTYGLNIVGTHDLHQSKLFDQNMIYNAILLRSVSYGYSNFYSITSSEQHFNPMSGFLIDRGFKSIYAVNGYTWQIKNKDALNYFDLTSEIYCKWRSTASHYLETMNYLLTPSLSFKNGMLFKSQVMIYNKDYLPFDWQFSDHVTIPSRFYKMLSSSFTFESVKTRRLIYTATLTSDKFYGGRRIAIAPEIYGGINKHVSLKFNYLYTKINFPESFSDNENGNYSSHLIVANILYCFSTRISLSGIVQYDNVSKVLGSNLRFRYNPEEGTDLYIVYNPTVNTEVNRFELPLPRVPQQVLIIKFTKTFRVKQ